jgi:hypothetical protein
MLPVALRFIVAMVAYAIDERMARRIDDLHEEVRVLRECLTVGTGRSRITFTDDQRVPSPRTNHRLSLVLFVITQRKRRR